MSDGNPASLRGSASAAATLVEGLSPYAVSCCLGRPASVDGLGRAVTRSNDRRVRGIPIAGVDDAVESVGIAALTFPELPVPLGVVSGATDAVAVGTPVVPLMEGEAD